jgi:hypothetical protein
VLEKLDFMVRFWDLKARHAAAGAHLTAQERGELLSLISLMASGDPLPEPGPAPHTDGVIVEMTARGVFLAAELRLVCAGGLVLASFVALPPGQSTLVRVVDPASGMQYTLPCVAAWSYPGNPTAVALCIDGVPARAHTGTPEMGAWRSPIGWSDPAEELVG